MRMSPEEVTQEELIDNFPVSKKQYDDEYYNQHDNNKNNNIKINSANS